MWFFKKGKTPFKKYFLARYIVWIEVIGFIFIGVLFAGMVWSTIYKINDNMKFSQLNAEPRREAVTVSTEAYVDSVEAREGDQVAEGQTLLTVTSAPENLPTLKAMASIQEALTALRKRPDGSAPPAAVEDSLTDALAAGKAAIGEVAPQPVKSPMAGVVAEADKGSLEGIKGKVVSGRVANVYTYDSRRFEVPVGGENAPRVRINLLAEEDVLSWKNLTEILKSENPPEDPAQRHIWERFRGKLDEVKPGKTPLKRLMPEIIATLNTQLRQPDFYAAEAWQGHMLPPEATELLGRDVKDLTPDEQIRLNRLLLQSALEGVIATSVNEHQPVNAKLYIPTEEKTAEGKTIKGKPKIFRVEGQVVHEPESGKVLIDLPDPPAEVVDYMKRQREDSDLPPVTCSGSVVVGRISLFRFLFK